MGGVVTELRHGRPFANNWKRRRRDPAAKLETIVNLQGDLPTLDPSVVRACLHARHEGGAKRKKSHKTL